MAVWLLDNAFPALARRRVLVLERATHPIPAGRYNSRLGLPLGLAWLGMWDAILIESDSPWLWTATVTIVGVVYLAILAFRSEIDDDAAETNWRQLPGDSSPFALRRTVARLAGRLAEWQAPLSRQQRDQAAWVLQHLSDASTRLRADADGSRLTWLRTDHPRATTTPPTRSRHENRDASLHACASHGLAKQR
ncbi:MAG TPA: hypothetical protein VMU51_27220 [Mycobacteriales bacterium]|nr:hypothetical protein [Mycobacteriales bacterium]